MLGGKPTTPITAVGNITGYLFPAYTLTAGAVAPSNATRSYQWMKCSTSSGTYTDINGATNSSFYVTGSEIGYYIKVRVTGTGNYSGTVISNPTASPIDGTLYYSASIYSYYTKNDCGYGYQGSSVLVSIPYGSYSSYGYQSWANALAEQAAQNYANANGSCNYIFWNDNSISGNIQKNDCPSGYAGTYVYCSVGPGEAWGYSQAEANNNAWYVLFNCANANGSCEWYGYESNQLNQLIQKNDCNQGTGSWIMCFAPTGMYVSQNSQAEADAWAQAALDGAYGQDLANYYGTCS